MTDSTAKLIRVSDVARRLSIGRTLAYELVANGTLRAIHVGAALRVPVDEIDRFISERLADEDLAPSDLMLPPADITLEEAREEFTGEGLLPD